MHLRGEIELRWYFMYKNLASKEKAKLNACPFLSLPILVDIPLLSSSRMFLQEDEWNHIFKHGIFQSNIYFNFAVGYRFAFSPKWLMEAKGGLYLYRYSIMKPAQTNKWILGGNSLINSMNLNIEFRLMYKL